MSIYMSEVESIQNQQRLEQYVGCSVVDLDTDPLGYRALVSDF